MSVSNQLRTAKAVKSNPKAVSLGDAKFSGSSPEGCGTNGVPTAVALKGKGIKSLKLFGNY